MSRDKKYMMSNSTGEKGTYSDDMISRDMSKHANLPTESFTKSYKQPADRMSYSEDNSPTGMVRQFESDHKKMVKFKSDSKY